MCQEKATKAADPATIRLGHRTTERAYACSLPALLAVRSWVPRSIHDHDDDPGNEEHDPEGAPEPGAPSTGRCVVRGGERGPPHPDPVPEGGGPARSQSSPDEGWRPLRRGVVGGGGYGRRSVTGADIDDLAASAAPGVGRRLSLEGEPAGRAGQLHSPSSLFQRP
jgi:hypothetical protein